MDGDSPENPSFDFGFAFNDENFSDRVLMIEILPDSPGSRHGPDDSLSGWVRNRKRRRDDQNIDINELPEQCEEQIFNCNVPGLDDGVASENQEDESAAGLDDAAEQDGQETAQERETSASMDFTAEQVRTIHVSSPILAAQSPYFFKLFTDGMRKSKQRHATLQIHASEEAALMDLLNFMYDKTLPRTTATALLDVLMAAEKFEVASCMKYCIRLLRNLPMSCESALLYLDLPSTIMMADTVRPLTDAAKWFLAAQFKDITKFQEEVLNLPLTGIEAILSSDDLQVASEDAVYDFTLKWARKHYPKSEERRGILNTRLLPHIRFSHMTSRKLRKVLMCPDIDCSLATKVVLDALFFKSEEPYRRLSTAAEDSKSPHRRFLERAYRYRPVKVAAFESPRQQCVVYLDLKREECLQLYPSSRLYSQAFPLGGQGFFLSGHCNMDQQSSTHCFGLFLGMQEKGSAVSTVDYEFASRTKPSKDFVCKYKGSYTFTGGKAVGYRNLFGVAWTDFVADDSPYFVNGVLHLRAELTLRK